MQEPLNGKPGRLTVFVTMLDGLLDIQYEHMLDDNSESDYREALYDVASLLDLGLCRNTR